MNDGQFVYPEKWMTYLLGRWPRTELGVPKKGKIKYLQHRGGGYLNWLGRAALFSRALGHDLIT